jgi:hypothetical protein
MQSSTGTKWKLAPVIISGHLYIFKALLFLERFHFSSAFISRALLFLERFYFSSAFISQALLFLERLYMLPSAFVFRALLSSERFCFPSVSQRLFIFFKCESALIYFSFQEHCSAPTLISGWEALKFLDHSLIIFIIILNMFQYQY